jgi:hypothetical protein
MFNDLLTADPIDTADCKVQGGWCAFLYQSECPFNFNASFHFRMSALKTMANVMEDDNDRINKARPCACRTIIM